MASADVPAPMGDERSASVRAPLVIRGGAASTTLTAASPKIGADAPARAKIVRVELTGVGFFVEFGVSPDAPRAEPKELTGGHVNIQVEGVMHGAGCLLFVRDGVIMRLEGYTYDDEWPERPVVVSLTEPIPLVPSDPGVS